MSAAPKKRALVLGGGGVAGWAWQAGLMAGLAEVGLRDADLVVGTSAGAITGARLALGLGGAAPVAPQGSMLDRGPVRGGGTTDATSLMARAQQSSQAERAQIGRRALQARTIGETASLARAVFAPFCGQPWPAGFRATTVSTRTGARRVWDARSGVPLERAVAASSAVPGLWPPITIGDDRYMDGATESLLNADLAIGSERAIVISCFALTGAGQAASGFAGASAATYRAELDAVRASGTAVIVVEPGPDFVALTRDGTAIMDPASAPEAFRLGEIQAFAQIGAIHGLWH